MVLGDTARFEVYLYIYIYILLGTYNINYLKINLNLRLLGMVTPEVAGEWAFARFLSIHGGQRNGWHERALWVSSREARELAAQFERDSFRELDMQCIYSYRGRLILYIVTGEEGEGERERERGFDLRGG